MNTSRHLSVSALNIAFLVCAGVAGSISVLYAYCLAYPFLGPRPSGAVLTFAHLPAVTSWAYVNT